MLAGQGRPAPAWADEPPPPRGEEAFAWRAFLVLSRSRGLIVTPAGTIPQPITLAEIAAFCALHGIAEGEARGDLLYLLQEMDAAYLESLLLRRSAQGKVQG